MKSVSCPIALHPDGAPRRLPVFEHPKGGLHLVTSALITGQNPDTIAARALYANSGLETRHTLTLGTSDKIETNTLWHFTLCRTVPPVREKWAHHCADGGGYLAKYHWLEIDHLLPAAMPQQMQNAIAWIRDTL